jgi:hypothetical protein
MNPLRPLPKILARERIDLDATHRTEIALSEDEGYWGQYPIAQLARLY